MCWWRSTRWTCVDYSEEVFLKLQKDFDALAKQLAVPHVVTIPISALAGDNVVERGAHMPWYHGPTFLEHLETVPIRMETPSDAVRFPVQYVIRPDASFRGFAGQVASGVIRPGDPVVSLPSEQKSRVKSIVTFDGDAPEAFPPMSVTLTLEDEIDLSRGDMLVSPAHPPRVSRHFDAMVVWFNAEPAEPGKSYLLKHTSRTVRAKALKIHYRVNVNTLVQEPASSLQMNDIAYVEFETVSPLFFDPYTQNRITGSFILIDPISNATLGAGMIRADLADQTVADDVAVAQEYVPVTAADRYKRHGHYPGLILVENNPGLATRLERALFDDHFEVAPCERERESSCLRFRIPGEARVRAVDSNLEPGPSLPFDSIPAARALPLKMKRKRQSVGTAASRLAEIGFF